MAAAFDTLTYAKKLQEAGFTPRQAEAQAEALRAVVDENLATKRDIEELRAATKRDIEESRAATQRDLKELENRLLTELGTLRLDMEHRFDLVRKDIELARRDTIIWLGGVIVLGTSAPGVLMKLL